MNRKESIAARFSASAATYDRYAEVQRITAEKVLSLLGRITVPETVLEVGCGTGIVTEKLQHQVPEAQLYALDISRAMIAQAQKRVTDSDSITWLTDDFLHITGETQFDCIISSSSLHWIMPIADAFKKAHSLLRPGGHCLLGIMVRGTLAELQQARTQVAPQKNVQTHLPHAEEVRAALDQFSFITLYHTLDSLRATFPCAADFITSIHEQGVTGGPVSRSEHLLNRSELADVIAYYDSHFRDTGNQVYATYTVLYILAQKRTD